MVHWLLNQVLCCINAVVNVANAFKDGYWLSLPGRGNLIALLLILVNDMDFRLVFKC